MPMNQCLRSALGLSFPPPDPPLGPGPGLKWVYTHVQVNWQLRNSTARASHQFTDSLRKWSTLQSVYCPIARRVERAHVYTYEGYR
jgi:hypothetical protein